MELFFLIFGYNFSKKKMARKNRPSFKFYDGETGKCLRKRIGSHNTCLKIVFILIEQGFAENRIKGELKKYLLWNEHLEKQPLVIFALNAPHDRKQIEGIHFAHHSKIPIPTPKISRL